VYYIPGRGIQVCDESLLTSLCNDVMTLVAAEAGGEVARMFEYQLALLLGAVDASSVSLIADHCAQRAVDYAVKVCLSFCLRSFYVLQCDSTVSVATLIVIVKFIMIIS